MSRDIRSYRPILDPATMWFLGTKFAVTQYERPEEYGNLLLPAAYQRDDSQTLWENLVTIKGRHSTEERPNAARALGLDTLPEGAIVITRRRWPADTGRDTPDGRPIFVSQAEDVVQIILPTWDPKQETE